MTTTATVPDTMQALAIDRFGEIGELTMRTLTVPRPDAGEVLIRVESAGVGVWDAYEVRGFFHQNGKFGGEAHFPYIPGSDAAGTVAAVGEGVEDFKPGDRVYAFTLANPRGGAYAQYVCLDAGRVSKVPGGLTTQQAGALPVDAMTALRGLDDTLHLKKGQTVMIFGAGGGIGHLAVQLAKRMGAKVLAVASGDDGVELAQGLGADAAVEGHHGDIAAAAKELAPGGLDAALLTAGGESAQRAIQFVREGGRVAHPGGVDEPQAPRGVSVHTYDGMPDPDAIAKLNKLIETSTPDGEPFTVHVAEAFALSEAGEAHRALEQHYLGKLVLRP